MKQSRINLVVIVSLCLALALTSFVLARRQTTPAPVADFSYVDSNGNSGTLYQFKDKRIVLHFWASWCVPCRAELPQLLDNATVTPETIYLLFSTDHTLRDMQAFVQPYQSRISKNIVFIHDPEMRITGGKFHIAQFPETIILNQDKTLQQHFIGPVTWRK